MNLHTLNIDAQFRPEVLERILRIVRHRGFAVRAMSMTSGVANEQVNLSLTVSSTRPVQNLCAQLGKLFDVRHVVNVAERERLSA